MNTLLLLPRSIISSPSTHAIYKNCITLKDSAVDIYQKKYSHIPVLVTICQEQETNTFEPSNTAPYNYQSADWSKFRKIIDEKTNSIDCTNFCNNRPGKPWGSKISNSSGNRRIISNNWLKFNKNLGKNILSTVTFWRRINRLRNNEKAKRISILRINGTEFETDEEKCNLFAYNLAKTFNNELNLNFKYY